MFRSIFLFELKYRLTSAGTWLCWLALLLMAYRELLGGELDQLVQSGQVARNAPYTLYYLFMYYTFWAATVGAVLMMPALLRDHKTGTANLIYSFISSPQAYFWGKYLASMLVLLLVMSSVVVGFVSMPALATLMGWYSAGDFIATPWTHIGNAYLWWIAPACLIYGSVSYALTALTGRTGAVYGLIMLAVGLFVLITALYGDGAPQAPWLQVIDPLGKVTLEGQLNYWTAEQRMSQFIQPQGPLLYNRLLYCGLALSLLIFASWRFELPLLLQRAHHVSAKVPDSSIQRPPAAMSVRPELLAPASNRGAVAQPSAWPKLQKSVAVWFAYSLHHAMHQAWGILRGKTFYLPMLTLLLMLLLAGLAYQTATFEGAGKQLPTAAVLLPGLLYPSLMFTLIAAVFFTVEICDKERHHQMAGLVDSCPQPDWCLVLSKLMASLLLAMVLALLPALSLLLVQLCSAFWQPDWTLLARFTGLVVLPVMSSYVLITLLCYGLTAHRMLTQVVAVMLGMTPAILSEVRTVENHLALWAWPFHAPLSDFAATGQFDQRNLDFALLWLSTALGLTVLAYWLWPRGSAVSLRERWQLALRRCSWLSIAVLLTGLGFGAMMTRHIHQQMMVQNVYQDQAQQQARQADYERRYGASRADAGPLVQHARLELSMQPLQRLADYQLTLTLAEPPSSSLVVQTSSEVNLHQLSISQTPQGSLRHHGQSDGQRQILHHHKHDSQHQRWVYPWPAQQAQRTPAELHLQLSTHGRGYLNKDDSFAGTVVADGSYLGAELWPTFHYDRNKELQSASLRSRYGLKPRPELPLGSAATTMFPRWSRDTKISVPAKQIALAPGELTVNPPVLLQTQAGPEQTLRHYSYRLDLPVPAGASAVAAAYQQQNQHWQGRHGAVRIEIYYLPKHDENIQHFIQAATEALQYGEALWGPYPYKTLRIAEIAHGISNSQVSANLVLIPEQQGWRHDYRSTPSIDWIRYQVARELARSWWQHVAIAQAQGHLLLTDAIPGWFGLQRIQAVHGETAAGLLRKQLTTDYRLARATATEPEVAVLNTDQQQYSTFKTLLVLDKAAQLLGQHATEQALQQLYPVPKLTRPTAFPVQIKALTAQHLLEALQQRANLQQRQQLQELFSRELPEVLE